MNTDDRECLTAHIEHLKHIRQELDDRIIFIEGYLNRHQPVVLETRPQIIGFKTTEKSWWKCTGCDTILHTQKEADDHKCPSD